MDVSVSAIEIMHSHLGGNIQEENVAFDALKDSNGDEGKAVHSFVKLIPQEREILARVFKRDALTRSAMAAGRLPDHMRYDKFDGMVHLSSIKDFKGAIPDDDPHRIKIVKPDSPLHAKIPVRAEEIPTEVSADFLRYTMAIYEADAAMPAPFVRPAGAKNKNPTSGVVHAGGAVLNEILLPDSSRKQVCLGSLRPEKPASSLDDEDDNSDDADDDDDDEVQMHSFNLKGGANDKDTFIVVQVQGDRTQPIVNAKTASQIARRAVEAMNPERFINKDKVCSICSLHLSTMPSKSCDRFKCRACFHDVCLHGAQAQLHNGSATTCPACKEKVTFRTEDSRDNLQPGITASRCTVNLQAYVSGSKDETAELKTIWQLTGRVYFDHRQPVAGFDIALSQVHFDGSDVWASEMGALSIANGVLPVTPFVMSNTCEFRMIKYVLRYGVDLYVPGLTQAAYDGIRPAPMRGVAGIKWLLREMQDGKGCSLDEAWNRFSQRVREVKKSMRVLMAEMPDHIPSLSWARYALPYVPMFINCAESLLDPSVRLDKVRAVVGVLEGNAKEIAGTRAHPETPEQIMRDMVARRDLPMSVRVMLNQRVNPHVAIADLDDYLQLLRYHTVQPGAQTFFQAQFERYKRGNCREGDVISAIACYDLWNSDSL